jgi:rare lipoprotein A (peptidoglycan hydrolase)
MLNYSNVWRAEPRHPRAGLLPSNDHPFGGTHNRSLRKNQKKNAPTFSLGVLCTIIACTISCTGTSRYGRAQPAENSDLASFRQTGVASYYADQFHGRTTANGERFDMHALTAAHLTLPFNTRVKVTNLSNGLSVVVRINDRGPYAKSRIIDLSYAAAKKIGLIGPGTAAVRIEIAH